MGSTTVTDEKSPPQGRSVWAIRIYLFCFTFFLGLFLGMIVSFQACAGSRTAIYFSEKQEEDPEPDPGQADSPTSPTLLSSDSPSDESDPPQETTDSAEVLNQLISRASDSRDYLNTLLTLLGLMVVFLGTGAWVTVWRTREAAAYESLTLFREFERETKDTLQRDIQEKLDEATEQSVKSIEEKGNALASTYDKKAQEIQKRSREAMDTTLATASDAIGRLWEFSFQSYENILKLADLEQEEVERLRDEAKGTMWQACNVFQQSLLLRSHNEQTAYNAALQLGGLGGREALEVLELAKARWPEGSAVREQIERSIEWTGDKMAREANPEQESPGKNT